MYMQSFIKIRGAVLEKNADKIMTLCNFNKDISVANFNDLIASYLSEFANKTNNGLHNFIENHTNLNKILKMIV